MIYSLAFWLWIKSNFWGLACPSYCTKLSFGLLAFCILLGWLGGFQSSCLLVWWPLGFPALFLSLRVPLFPSLLPAPTSSHPICTSPPKTEKSSLKSPSQGCCVGLLSLFPEGSVRSDSFEIVTPAGTPCYSCPFSFSWPSA